MYRAEGFQALAKIEVRANGRQILATLNVVDNPAIVGRHELGLSEDAFATAAQTCLAAGAISVDVAVTHALFAGDALDVMARAGVGQVWSTDCIAHPSNAVSVAAMISAELT